jgi:putative glutamine amidotransferase
MCRLWRGDRAKGLRGQIAHLSRPLMKPLVGITTYLVSDEELQGHRPRGVAGQDMMMSNLDYSRSLLDAGAIPVALPVVSSLTEVGELVARLDALLLAGGEDLDPALFGREAEPGLGPVSERRDRYEWALLAAALARGIPVLGICRGLQLLNVFFGGTLHQDLASSFPSQVPHHSAHRGREALVHEVTLAEGSFLHHAYGCRHLWVNSLHHQGIETLAPPLREVASSWDGLVEGVAHATIANVFAVQWHPEMMTERHLLQRELFRYFVARVRESSAGKG